MGHADQLRVGPCAPEPGRHSGRTVTAESTAEYPQQRPRFAHRTTVTVDHPEWLDARPYAGASDGVIVQTIGNWGNGVGEGALRFNNVVVPGAGTYALTVFYVNPNNEPTRSVIITASGSGSVSLTVAGSAACCSAQQV